MNTKIITVKQMKRTDGFTLIELMISLAIFSLVLAAAYGLFNAYSRSSTTQTVVAETQQDILAAMGIMEQEIRMAGFNPTNTLGIADIASATATQFHFRADLDRDGTVGGTDEDVTYTYNAGAGTIIRNANGVDDEIISDVTAFSFSYFDDSTPPTDLGNPVSDANRGNIRSVRISMTVQKPAGRSGTVDRTMTTDIFCRNLSL